MRRPAPAEPIGRDDRSNPQKKADHKADLDEAAHLKAECALRDHPSLGRWLQHPTTGRLS